MHMLSFNQFLTEGGNIIINGIPAERLNLKQLDRNTVVASLRSGLNAINVAFEKKSGFPLWAPGLFNSGDFLSGSSKWFFDLTSIDTAKFVEKKPSVGDVDLQVDGASETLVKAFLDSLQPGTQLGTLKWIGYKYSVDQFITLWETDFGQTVQIDFELVEYVNGKPTAWSTFSHSSAWKDLEQGIKGVASKYLFRALTAKKPRDVIILKGAKQVPTPAKTTDYVASLKGIRQRLQPVIDPVTKEHKHIGGVPVYTELQSKGATFLTDMEVFFSILFDVKPTQKDLSDINSFVGMIELIKKYITNRLEQKNILDRFTEILFGRGAQGLYRGREGRLQDFREKTVILRYICKELGFKWNEYLPMIKTYYRSYK